MDRKNRLVRDFKGPATLSRSLALSLALKMFVRAKTTGVGTFRKKKQRVHLSSLLSRLYATTRPTTE